jgi:nucleotide-binding universal stress UspA family protein
MLAVEERMYERILLGMDAGGHATQALPVVTTLARTSGGEVVVLHVRDASLDEVSPAVAEGHVDEAVAALTAAGVRARGEVAVTLDRDPVGRIVAGSRELGADLVALGSRGRTHVGGLLLGSVSHAVAAKLDVPVLLVHERPDGELAAAAGPIQRVLVAVDASDRASGTLAAARELAGEQGAALLAVHAREVGFFGGAAVYIEPEPSAAELMERAEEQLAGSGRYVETRVLDGDEPIAARIVDAADQWVADVIVLGSRRLTDLGGLLLGSVAHDVVRRTSRPVLLAARAPVPAR